jgi:hypothetical protein
LQWRRRRTPRAGHCGSGFVDHTAGTLHVGGDQLESQERIPTSPSHRRRIFQRREGPPPSPNFCREFGSNRDAAVALRPRRFVEITQLYDRLRIKHLEKSAESPAQIS